MACRHGHELLAAADEERIATYKQRPGALLHEGRKGRNRWPAGCRPSEQAVAAQYFAQPIALQLRPQRAVDSSD